MLLLKGNLSGDGGLSSPVQGSGDGGLSSPVQRLGCGGPLIQYR